LYVAFFVAAIALYGCGNSQDSAASGETAEAPKLVEIDENDITESVIALIDNNEFKRAFDFLAAKDQANEEVQLATQRVHLNYGLGLMNMTVSSMTQGQQPAGGMRSNMYEAMRQFLKAHYISPESEAAGIARQQIQSIMSVYATMPDRLDKIPTGIRDSLKTIGYDL
jgi:hypothetical protein